MKRDLVVVVAAIFIGLAVGVFSATQRKEIKYFETRLDLGVRGVLAWAPNENDPCDLAGENIALLLTCYLGLNSDENRDSARVIPVPVEAPETLWRRLASTYRLADARKDRIPYPHLYQVIFLENQRGVTLTVRDKDTEQGVRLLKDISSSIINQHSLIVTEYRQALETYRDQLLHNISMCSSSPNDHPCWTRQDARAAILNIVSTAIVESRYPEILDPIRQSSQSKTMFSFRIFSAGFIGLITGVFIALARSALNRALTRLRDRYRFSQKSDSDI